jgi:hypothetical protein
LGVFAGIGKNLKYIQWIPDRGEDTTSTLQDQTIATRVGQYALFQMWQRNWSVGESSRTQKLGWHFAFANYRVSMRCCFNIQNGNSA